MESFRVFVLVAAMIQLGICSPTLTWLSSQLERIQNLTQQPFVPTTTDKPSTLRICRIVQGCVNINDCPQPEVETVSTIAPVVGVCSGKSAEDCWWDLPGCLITTRVSPCACVPNK